MVYSLCGFFDAGAETASAETYALSVNASRLQIHFLSADRRDIGVTTRVRLGVGLLAEKTVDHKNNFRLMIVDCRFSDLKRRIA